MTGSNITSSSNSESNTATSATSMSVNIDNFDSSTYRRVSRGGYMSPGQLKALLTGGKVNISIGEAGNRFVALEGAYTQVLKKYSGLARDTLSRSGATTLIVEVDANCKDSVRWTYQYMLAGETDSQFEMNDKFADKDFEGLVRLYKVCQQLRYQRLANVAWNRMRELIQENCCWDVEIDDLKYVADHIPEMIEVIAEGILFYTAFSVLIEDVKQFKYIEEIFNDAQIGEPVQTAMETKLVSWVQRSEKYYARQRSFNDVLRYETRQGQLARRECYACGGLGHIARLCPASADIKAAHKAKCGKASTRTATTTKQTVAAAGKAPTKALAAKPSTSTIAAKQVKGSTKKVDITATSPPSYAAVVSAPVMKETAAPSKVSTKTPAPVNIKAKPYVQAQAPTIIKSHASVAIKSHGPVIVESRGPINIKAEATGTVHLRPTPPPVVATAQPKTKPTIPAITVTNQAHRPALTCYNCGNIGHIARYCWAPQQNGYRGNNSGGRNGYRNVVMPSPNGEGITTCSHELKQGQRTRLGLLV